MKKIVTTTLLTTSLLLGSTAAMATTITFDGTAGGLFTDYTPPNPPYIDASGFVLAPKGAGTQLLTYDNLFNPAPGLGTDYADFEQGAQTVTLSYASPFSLLSFDGAADLIKLAVAGSFTLTGYVANVATFSQTFSTLANGGWNNYTLTGWNNLSSVDFHSTVDVAGLDNINVTTGTGPAPASVPVPATLWLLVSGFAGLAYSVSRKNRIA